MRATPRDEVVVVTEATLVAGSGSRAFALPLSSSPAAHAAAASAPPPPALRSPFGLARALFLPAGLGDRSDEYVRFQLLDTLQGACSYLRGVQAVHATLVGAGMAAAAAAASSPSAPPAEAAAAATALAAVATFVLKDGAGKLASLAFATSFAPAFDCEVKCWRLFADLANDVGLTLELVAPLLRPELFLPATCLANVCRALCGVAAGATRVAVSQHFASAALGNVAEVQAKEGTQETAVELLGLLLGALLTRAFAGNVPFGLAAFALLTAVHVISNYAAMRLLTLRAPSRGRLYIALMARERAAAAQRAAAGPAAAEALPPAALLSPAAVAAIEPVLLPLHYASGLRARLPAPLAWLLCGDARRKRLAEAPWPPSYEDMDLALGCGLEAVATVAAAAAAERGGAWARHALLVAFGDGAEAAAVPLADARALRAALQRCDRDGFVIAVSGERGESGAAGTMPRAAVAFLARASPATRLFAYEAAFRAAVLGRGLEEAVRSAGAARAGLDADLRGAGWETSVPRLDEEGVRIESLEVGVEEGAAAAAAAAAVATSRRRRGSSSPARRR